MSTAYLTLSMLYETMFGALRTDGDETMLSRTTLETPLQIVDLETMRHETMLRTNAVDHETMLRGTMIVALRNFDHENMLRETMLGTRPV